MNKFFTKIATLSVGLVMAIGVGVAIGGRDVAKANASQTVTLNKTVLNMSNTNAQYTDTTTGFGFTVYGSNNSGIQIKSSYSLKNTTALSGSITNLAFKYKFSGGSGTATITFGTSASSINSNTQNLSGGTTEKTANIDVSGSYTFVSFNATYRNLIITNDLVITYESGTSTTYSVTYLAGTHGTLTGSGNVFSGLSTGDSHEIRTPAAVGISAKSGYSFDCWYNGDTPVTSESITIATSNITLTAHWEEIPIVIPEGYLSATVTATASGSAVTVNGINAIKVGTSKAKGSLKITIPKGTTNLLFCAAAWNGDSTSVDISAPNGVSITSNSSAVSSISLTNDEGISGSSSDYTLVTNPSSIYLIQWVLSGVTESVDINFTAVNDANNRFVVWNAYYYANVVTHDVTFDLNGGSVDSSTDDIVVQVEDGEKPEYPEPTRTGYEFTGWNNGNTPIDPDEFVVTEDVTLTAQWAAVYDIIYDKNTTDEVDGMPANGTSVNGTYQLDSTTTPTRTGYSFKGWGATTTATASDKITQVTINNANVTVYAIWVQSFKIQFNSNGGSSSPAAIDVDKNGTFTFPSPGTKSHHSFDGWSNDSGSTKHAAGTTSSAVTASTTYVAYWTEAAKYTVTYDKNNNGAGGTVPTDSNTYYSDDSITVKSASTLTAPTGMTFVNWNTAANGSGASYSAGDTFTTSANVTLYAIWVNVWDVTYTDGTNNYVVEDVHQTNAYELIDFEDATGLEAPSGYVFKCWNVEIESVATDKDPGDTIVLNANTTITAVFEEKTNLGNLVDKEYFFVIVGGHVLKAGEFSAGGADTYTTDNSTTTGLAKSDAWYFTTTGVDDQWYIRTSNSNDAAYLGASNANNGLVSESTADSWTVKEGTGKYEDKLIMQDSTQSRYISYTTSTGAHIRVYTSTSNGDLEVSFVKYQEVQLEITGKTEEYTDTAVKLTSNAGAATSWSITSNPGSIGSLSSDSGATTDLSVSGAGTVVVTATANGYIADTHSVTFTLRPTYFIDLSGECTNGTDDLGINGQTFMVSVDDSNLAGNIDWEVTSGAVSGITSDNDGFLATFASTGTVTITATDLGHAENTKSISFTVVESFNAINAYLDSESKLVFTAACNGSGTTDDSINWTIAGSTGSSNVPESAFDPTKGVHYGTSSSAATKYQVKSITLTSASSYSNITSITVNASTAQSVTGATVSVTVGGVAFGGEAKTITDSAAEYTFTGALTSGAVVVTITKDSSSYGALYCKSVVVGTRSSETSDIANTDATIQQAVLDFVTTMNTDLAVCSGSATLSTSVWASLATKFEAAATSFENASDEDLFRRMFKYADATPRAGDGSATTGDTLQNALARYNYVLEKYGVTNYADFLHRAEANKVTPKASSGINVLGLITRGNSSATIIVVVISAISVAAIGGYFFFRKKKED